MNHFYLWHHITTSACSRIDKRLRLLSTADAGRYVTSTDNAARIDNGVEEVNTTI